MKNHLLALVLGALFAAIIVACGGASPSKSVTGFKLSPHDEIASLDARITADLSKMNEPAPTLPPNTCSASCPPEQMSGAAKIAATEDATCQPAQTATCTESCNLKKSICEAATRICTIASDLGGADSYANDKCHAGTASCEAAKKRCCNCT